VIVKMQRVITGSVKDTRRGFNGSLW